MLRILSHYHCNQNNSPNPAEAPVAQQAGEHTISCAHDKVDKNLSENLCCMWFPPLVLSSLASFHPALSPLKAEMAHILPIKHCLCRKTTGCLGTGCFSELAAVHLVTVAEEYISASHFLVTMPAICLPAWRGEPEGRTPWMNPVSSWSFAGWTSSALAHLMHQATRNQLVLPDCCWMQMPVRHCGNVSLCVPPLAFFKISFVPALPASKCNMP